MKIVLKLSLISGLSLILNNSVLAGDMDDPAVSAGKKMYNTLGNCVTCHGKDATGGYGPNIQGKDLDKINYALTTFDDMKMWEQARGKLTTKEKTDLVAYLSTLVGVEDDTVYEEEASSLKTTISRSTGIEVKAGVMLGHGFSMGPGLQMSKAIILPAKSALHDAGTALDKEFSMGPGMSMESTFE